MVGGGGCRLTAGWRLAAVRTAGGFLGLRLRLAAVRLTAAQRRLLSS